MKQLLILSGKGGTGKTTVAAAFIRLSPAKAYADCDVDAPNMHLITELSNNVDDDVDEKDYFGLPTAQINENLCLKCGKCLENCRFDAVLFDKQFYIDRFACEGCGVCAYVCPAGAIILEKKKAGELKLYCGGKSFSTARLEIGSGTSGKLVSEVKKRLAEAVGQNEFAVIDGSPGIGCPVIASLSGADMALIVTEPTLSGINDLKRIVKTARYFGVRMAVCVNKFDVNEDNTQKIVDFCKESSLPFAGKIPYDKQAVTAVNDGVSIVDVDCSCGRAVKNVFAEVMKIMAVSL